MISSIHRVVVGLAHLEPTRCEHALRHVHPDLACGVDALLSGERIGDCRWLKAEVNSPSKDDPEKSH